jgi:acetyl esterase/lipase
MLFACTTTHLPIRHYSQQLVILRRSRRTYAFRLRHRHAQVYTCTTLKTRLPMRTAALTFIVALCMSTVMSAQSPVLLWPDGAPGALGTADTDKPKITVYIPKDRATRTGIVVLPGGGYSHLALDHEGKQVAQWLNNLGVAAFVVEYRFAPYHHPIELGDAMRAMRYVRSHSTEFNIASNRIGIWGFSAGGHLASTLGTHFDAGNPSAADPIERASCRPDFMVLTYAVIEPTGRGGNATFRNLLGENPDPALVRELSNHLHVTADTPPTFLVQADDDQVVPAENSVDFYLALRKAGVPAEMHIYQNGGHGFGLAPLNPTLSSWTGRLSDWMRGRGLL